MAERKRVIIPFGPGLDRASGALIVQPHSVADLRNVYPVQGKVVMRDGFASVGALPASGYGPITHILAGHALRSESVGIVVGYSSSTRAMQVFRTEPDGSAAEFLGLWHTLAADASSPPIVSMAENYGRIFMAHDEPRVSRRAPTFVYGPLFGATLSTLTSDLGDGDLPISFRGVISHLDYLFGWGFGSPTEDRPEMLRASLPGQPTEFLAPHHWALGDRRDPILAAGRAGRELVIFKGGETHRITGYDRRTFGAVREDPLYGISNTRLLVEANGEIYYWSQDGPRVTDGRGPSSSIELPLELAGFEPADLVLRGGLREAFGAFLPDQRTVLFVFGRRCYALSLHSPQEAKWSYWELGFEPFCVFFLENVEVDGSTDGPGAVPDYNAYPAWTSVEPAGTYADVTVTHNLAIGDELVELWARVQGSGDPYTLRTTTNINAAATQVLRVAPLQEVTIYDGAVRYRRGTGVNASYSLDPSTWPPVSRGTIVTTFDPPLIGLLHPGTTVVLDGVPAPTLAWDRTASDATVLRFRITPVAVGADINVYRRTGLAGEWALLDTVDDSRTSEAFFIYDDDNPPPHVVLYYRLTTVVDSEESGFSRTLRMWSGPLPQMQQHLREIASPLLSLPGEVYSTHVPVENDGYTAVVFRHAAHASEFPTATRTPYAVELWDDYVGDEGPGTGQPEELRTVDISPTGIPGAIVAEPTVLATEVTVTDLVGMVAAGEISLFTRIRSDTFSATDYGEWFEWIIDGITE